MINSSILDSTLLLFIHNKITFIINLVIIIIYFSSFYIGGGISKFIPSIFSFLNFIISKKDFKFLSK